jgi:glutamate synthase domain-containing protein 2
VRPVGVSICKAIVETRIYPDFIAVDGGEGGTGAAPPEYSNSIGTPLRDGLAFAIDCLNGFDLKKDIVVMASGKIITGFDVIRNIALGADVCQSARAMMLALGCIQALECHKNNCPTGVATQDPNLVAGLVVADKEKRVAQYHKETVEAAREIIASMGFSAVSELKREHIFRRVDYTRVSTYEEIYPSMAAGDIVDGSVPAHLEKYFASASANSFLVNSSRTPG